MIGKCPHCNIELDKPPFNERVRSELIIVLTYRRFIDNNIEIRSIKELGYCEVCNATVKDLEIQNIMIE